MTLPLNEKNPQKSSLDLPLTTFQKFILFIILALFFVGLVINIHVLSFGKQFILAGDSANTDIFGDNPTDDIPVVLVLGASVFSNGTLSPTLQARVDTALDLYEKGIVKKILVSGDNQTESYNEVIPVRNFLLEQKVPPEDIFVDFAGFDTYDSLYRARNIFGVRNVIVVTQSFHLPRALYVARKLGLASYGVSADRGGLYVKDNIREKAAIIKTFFEVQNRAEPKFLGRSIPISGDGQESLK